MSIRILSKVMRESDETLGRRLILIALADSASDDGICWPLQDEVARKTRLTKKHVSELLVALEADGAIETRKAQRGRRRVNVYRLRLGDLSEPDYDRLPFTLDRPFSTPEIPEPSIEATDPDLPLDGSGSTGATSPDLSPLRARDPLSEPSGEPLGEPSSALARRPVEVDQSKPPKLTKIDGRDLAFDALAEVCGVDPSGNRGREVGLALNGGGPSKLVGIRELAWAKMQAGLAQRAAPGEEFERTLAAAIRSKGHRYRQAMPGAALTPLALAKWWTDVDRATIEDPTRVRPEQILAAAAQLREEGR